METTHLDYLLTDDPARVDFAAVHSWLTDSYWSPGISREKCEQAARHSAVVVSVFYQSKQIGYCRVVSDRTRFAWLADVYVHADHRGRGLGRSIVRFALEHPSVADVSNWLLGTKDAHGVYAELGFAPLAEPHRFMQLRRHSK